MRVTFERIPSRQAQSQYDESKGAVRGLLTLTAEKEKEVSCEVSHISDLKGKAVCLARRCGTCCTKSTSDRRINDCVDHTEDSNKLPLHPPQACVFIFHPVIASIVAGIAVRHITFPAVLSEAL
ncbi:unnamed protein product [Leuciscus chuanchicus]